MAEWRLEKWFPHLGQELHSKFKIYYDELSRFNPTINLVSVQSLEVADQVHFADSILAGQIVLSNTKFQEIYDIGSGNGFPGLVLACLAPERSFVLVDKDQRKVEFLKNVISKLGLTNVKTQCTLIANLPEASISCAISRGLASLTKSILGMNLKIKNGGEYYHMKSDAWVREVAELPAQALYVWEPSLIQNYVLPESNKEFSIVLTKKV